jgi:Flp pilus assembly protein TadB
MALFVNQNSNRTKLQERLAAELTEKAKQKSKMENTERPDGVTDSNYLKDTKSTTSLAWVWIVIVIIVVGVMAWLMAKPK